MTGKLTVSRKFHIAREGLGRKRFREGEEAAKPARRIQRVSRVIALFHQPEHGSDQLPRVLQRRSQSMS